MTTWLRRCRPLLPPLQHPAWSDNTWLEQAVPEWRVQQPPLGWDGDQTDVTDRLTPCNTRYVADDPNLTAFAGMPLFIAFTQKLGLAGALSRHLRIGKRKSDFSVAEIGECLVDAIVCGVERIEHTNVIKGDPALAAARGLRRLPDHATHHRYVTQFEEAHVGELQDAFWELFKKVNRPRGRRVPAKRVMVSVCLDFDATAACVYGAQEEAAFGHYHAKDGHRELSILTGFVGSTGDALGARLRAGNRHSNHGALEFIQECFERLPQGMVPAWVRLDSGFFDTKTLRWLEERGVEYAIGIPVDARLRAMAMKSGTQWRRISPDIEVCDFEYAWQADGKTRRVLLTRHPDPKKTKPKPRPGYPLAGLRGCPEGGVQPALLKLDPECGEYPAAAYTYFALVTNNTARSANSLWQWYAGRARLENSIKEAKLGFGLDRLPSKRFWANAAYIWFVLLAYNLMNWFKRLLLAGNDAKRQVKGLRHRLLCVPGLLRRGWGRPLAGPAGPGGWIVHLPLEHPSAELFGQVREALARGQFG